jgi:hypothetical protein
VKSPPILRKIGSTSSLKRHEEEEARASNEWLGLRIGIRRKKGADI